MTYRYAIVSGLFIGLLAGVIVEWLAWLVYKGSIERSAGALMLVLTALGAVVIVGRWYESRARRRTRLSRPRSRVRSSGASPVSVSARHERSITVISRDLHHRPEMARPRSR